MSRSWLAFAAFVGTLIAGCSEPSRSAMAPQIGAPPSLRKDWEAVVRRAATEYKSWYRVSDYANWAPTECRIPPRAGALHSSSDDAETHGGKLYFLFASNQQAYPRPMPGVTVVDQPLGQVIVKEAFAAKLCSYAEATAAAERALSMPADTLGQRTRLPDEYAQRHEGQTVRTYKAGDPAGLFMMFKTAPTPDTDRGWVYATMKPDGAITSLGRVMSCMSCHEHAKYDRLFGPVYSRPPVSPR